MRFLAGSDLPRTANKFACRKNIKACWFEFAQRHRVVVSFRDFESKVFPKNFVGMLSSMYYSDEPKYQPYIESAISKLASEDEYLTKAVENSDPDYQQVWQ